MLEPAATIVCGASCASGDHIDDRSTIPDCVFFATALPAEKSTISLQEAYMQQFNQATPKAAIVTLVRETYKLRRMFGIINDRVSEVSKSVQTIDALLRRFIVSF